MVSPLADRKCVPCRGGTPPLTGDEIAPLRVQLEDGWEVEEGKRLVRTFTLKDFLEAVHFVNAITPVAEEEGHHPNLWVRWAAVQVLLWTHKIDGLTESDFVMAAKIERLYHQATKFAAGESEV